MKYNIDWFLSSSPNKFNMCKLFNDIYSFDSNINYSDYLYNSLLSILVYCTKYIGYIQYLVHLKYTRMEWNNKAHENHVIAISYYLTW